MALAQYFPSPSQPKVLIDRSIPKSLADELADKKLSSWRINYVKSGMSDDQVIDEAVEKEALILTCDRDFPTSGI